VLVPRHEGEFAEVGVAASVAERVRLPGGGQAVTVEAEHRALVGAAQTGAGRHLFVDVEEVHDEVPVDGRTRTLAREYARSSRRSSSCAVPMGASPAGCARSAPGALADSCGYSPDLNYEQRLELLRTWTSATASSWR